MKYAIIESGGKQYRAVEGSVIEVDRLDAEVGQSIELGSVLFLVDGDTQRLKSPASIKISIKPFRPPNHADPARF